jgi:hypothetical protein
MKISIALLFYEIYSTYEHAYRLTYFYNMLQCGL